ncbi:MAG: GAF domain-containing protein [Acidobacteria bacterium]|nr:GAF domain-containing protein [Acidobacteriota bacterium]
MPRNTAQRPLASLLAHSLTANDLFPLLHQHALDVTGGACSLLLQHNPRTGSLQATSAFGLDTLRTDPWLPAPDESSVVSDAFARRAPALVADAAADIPDLADRLGTRSALLLPLVRGSDRVGLLTIGFHTPPSSGSVEDTGLEVADAFITALELLHLRQADQLQRDVRELLDEFTASLAATLNLAAGLDIFCVGANRLFGADRTSVWIHDRRGRQLVLQASSDTADVSRGVRLSTDDPTAPAAVAMRRIRSEIVPLSEDAITPLVTVPLRGTRRALGTVVFEGVRVETGGEIDLLDRADELGRQLSSAIENLQLLDDVMRARRELENTFDSITHLIAVADMRGHIVHVNQAFASRVGRTREELLDQPIAGHIGPQLAGWLAERRETQKATKNAEPAVTREVLDSSWNGPFMVTVTDLLNHEREPVGSVVVARDLTTQTRLESEREELRKRLTQSEKLAALGQFVAGIAHELNNPLQGVLGHLELMRVTGAFPKQLRREVQTIYREADRAAKIVRNLLVFAGSRRLVRRSVSLNVVLQKVLSLRAPAHRAIGIEVVRHYDDKLPRVPSDPLLLHQVFLNMVMNAEHAIAATGHGGRIEIRTSVSPARDRIITTVRDTGTGIPEDTLSRIFEPFYTTKEVGKGTGLGLAITYGIVQEHGGQILAANHPEGGAVFTVELPTAPSPRRHQDADA